MKKIYLLDFDGTIYLKDDLVQTEKNIKALNFSVDMGATCVIVTARPYFKITDYLSKFNIKSKYLICSNGGLILGENNQEIYNNPIHDRLSCEIANYLEKYKEIPIEYQSKQDFRKGNLWLLNTYLIWLSTRSIETAETIKSEAEAKFPQLSVCNDHNSVFFCPRGNSKINALEKLFLKTGMNPLNAHGVGDALTDLEMIQKYNGYSIGNMYGNMSGDRVVETLEDVFTLTLK